jgi:hypothetical protein
MKCPPLLLKIVMPCSSRAALLITIIEYFRGDMFRTGNDCSVVSFDDQERIHDMELVIIAQRTASSDDGQPLDGYPPFRHEV